MSNKLKVDLNDVIECIEFEGELLQHYYNKNTGVIMYIEDSSTASYKADDIHNIELELPPFSGDADIIDDFVIEDNIETELINTTITDNPNIESADFTDIIDTELINTI